MFPEQLAAVHVGLCEKAMTFPAQSPCPASKLSIYSVLSPAQLRTHVTGGHSCVEISLTWGCQTFCSCWSSHTAVSRDRRKISNTYLFLRAIFSTLYCVARYFHAGGYHSMTLWRAKQSIPSPSAQHQNCICHFAPCITSFLLHSFCCHCFISCSPHFPGHLSISSPLPFHPVSN